MISVYKQVAAPPQPLSYETYVQRLAPAQSKLPEVHHQLQVLVSALDQKNNASEFQTIPEVQAQILETFTAIIARLVPASDLVEKRYTYLFKYFCTIAKMPEPLFAETTLDGISLILAQAYVGQSVSLHAIMGPCMARSKALWRESRSLWATKIQEVPGYCAALERLCHEASDISHRLKDHQVLAFCIGGIEGQAKPDFLTCHYPKTLACSVSPNIMTPAPDLFHFNAKLWDTPQRTHHGYEILQVQAASVLKRLFEHALSQGKKLVFFDTLGERIFSKPLLRLFHHLGQRYGFEKMAYVHYCSCCLPVPMKYVGYHSMAPLTMLEPRMARQTMGCFLPVGTSDPFDIPVMCLPCNTNDKY